MSERTITKRDALKGVWYAIMGAALVWTIQMTRDSMEVVQEIQATERQAAQQSGETEEQRCRERVDRSVAEVKAQLDLCNRRVDLWIESLQGRSMGEIREMLELGLLHDQYGNLTPPAYHIDIAQSQLP